MKRRRGSSCSMTSLVFRSSLSKDTGQQTVYDHERFSLPQKVAVANRKNTAKPWKKKKGEPTFAEEKPCSVGIRVFVGHLMQKFGQLRGATEELEKKGVCDEYGRSSPRDNHNDEGKKIILTTPTSV